MGKSSHYMSLGWWLCSGTTGVRCEQARHRCEREHHTLGHEHDEDMFMNSQRTCTHRGGGGGGGGCGGGGGGGGGG
eukprot:352630-Chlamydomonas_euryale.AAC.1